jgi:hypothetical protein
VFAHRAQPNLHGLDTGDNSGVVTEKDAAKGGEEGLKTRETVRTYVVCVIEGDGTHREDTRPDIPGGVRTDAIASSDCSTCHDRRESTSVRGKTTCTLGGREWRRKKGARTKGQGSGMDSSFI